MKLLILGYSKFVQKRLIPSIKKNKLFDYEICSKHSNDKSIKYRDYAKAINSKPDLVYISLTNNLHFKYAKLCLKKKLHIVVDKPLTTKDKQTYELVKIAKSNKVLLAEATLFNYHNIFETIENLVGGRKNIIQISSYFHIPKNKNLNRIISTKSDCFQDMSPYAAAIIRLYLGKKKLMIKTFLKKSSNKIFEKFQIFAKSKNKSYFGSFSHNQEYLSQINFFSKNMIIIIPYQAFALRGNKKVKLIIKHDNFSKQKYFHKDDCIKNFLNDVKQSIIKKKYKNFYSRIILDCEIKNLMLAND